MYNTTQAPATVTITLTQEQFDMINRLVEQEKQKHLNVADWTGETVEEIEAMFQMPHDSIIDDMIDSYNAQYSGIPMF